jgi:hypothetical protein
MFGFSFPVPELFPFVFKHFLVALEHGMPRRPASASTASVPQLKPK